MTLFDSMLVPLCCKSPQKNLVHVSQPNQIWGGWRFGQNRQPLESDWVDSRNPNFFWESKGLWVQIFHHLKSFERVYLGFFDMGLFFLLLY